MGTDHGFVVLCSRRNGCDDQRPCHDDQEQGRTAEDWIIPERYPLHELPHGGYAERTARNIINSDGTVIIHFGHIEGGTRLTVDLCREHGKPHRLIDGSARLPADAAAAIREFIEAARVVTLNVAGPRASEDMRGYGYARDVVRELLETSRRQG